MTDQREAKIRERAHALWEQEGRPEGRHDEHWQQACREVDEESGGSSHASAQTAAPAQPSEAPAKDGAPPASAPAAEAELEPTPKRRGRKPKTAEAESGAGELFGETASESQSDKTSAAPTARRGRKPKTADSAPAGGDAASAGEEAPAAAPAPAPARRGRPRKNRV